jgi:hypothetical protein
MSGFYKIHAASDSRPEHMTTRARGRFEVKVTPVEASEEAKAAGILRMTLAKVLEGDLVGTSRGEMFAFRTSVEGSGGYVAMERIEGTLAGKKGSFVMQHDGRMERGARSLSVVVVPDSGTGELTGLSGTLDIIITDGEHTYDFVYTLP